MEMGAGAAIEPQEAGGPSHEGGAFKEEDAPSGASTSSRWLAYSTTRTQPRLIALRP